MAFCLLTFNGQMSEKTGWVSGDDGFLALDKNNNNNIDDISELFGNQNQSGFSELSTYDTNNDNKIDSSDDTYSSLKIWQDRDGDGSIMLHMVQRGRIISCNETICEFYSRKLDFS